MVYTDLMSNNVGFPTLTSASPANKNHIFCSLGGKIVFFNTTFQKHQFFQCSAFFISHPFMTTGKTTALTLRTFIGKVMSLLFSMLSRLVIAFLPRSKLWLQSPSAVTLEPKKIKPVTVSIVSPSICHEVMGLGAIVFVF